MYYEQYGQGRILVLLPGGLATIQRNYENQIPVLSAAHQVIAIEQVGHGHTPDANIEWSYPQMADDTAALLGILKVQNADLIGHSDGAILALLVARRHPELVRRLVISGANTRLVGMTPEEAKEIQASSPEQLAEKLGPDRKAAYLAVSPDGPSHWPMAAKKIWNLWITPIILEKEDLLAIKAPALVVCGDRDIIPIQHTLEIFNTLPNAQLLVIPGCGHLRNQWLTGRALPRRSRPARRRAKWTPPSPLMRPRPRVWRLEMNSSISALDPDQRKAAAPAFNMMNGIFSQLERRPSPRPAGRLPPHARRQRAVGLADFLRIHRPGGHVDDIVDLGAALHTCTGLDRPVSSGPISSAPPIRCNSL